MSNGVGAGEPIGETASDNPIPLPRGSFDEGCESPLLSVIVPTDEITTIDAVIEHLLGQTICKRLELVVVVPTSAEASLSSLPQRHFCAVRLEQIESIIPLGAARAAGVRAATAPFVFVGETHSYLHPDAAEKLLASVKDRRYAAVSPGFVNHNPSGALSWAAFLGDYGRWSAALPAGEIPEVPVYNALFRREVLTAMGDRLADLLQHGDELRKSLQEAGLRSYFEPSARVRHVNIDRPLHLLNEHLLVGRVIGSQRAQRWSRSRRLFYVLAAPLIPLVLIKRDLRGVLRTLRVQPARLALPLIVLLKCVRAFGEMIGYATGEGKNGAGAAQDHYEIRKLDYVVQSRGV